MSSRSFYLFLFKKKNKTRKAQLITTVLKYKLLIPIYRKLPTRATVKTTMFIFILHKNSKGIPCQFLKGRPISSQTDHKKISSDKFVLKCVLSQGIILVSIQERFLRSFQVSANTVSQTSADCVVPALTSNDTPMGFSIGLHNEDSMGSYSVK